MKITEAIRSIMTEKGVRIATMCARIGIGSNVFCNRLKQNDMTIGKALEILRVLDYKIVVMPREVSTPKGGIEVE